MQVFIDGSRLSRGIFASGVLLLLLAGCTRSPEAVRDRSVAAGRKLMQKGDHRRAVLEFKNAVQAMPRDADAQYELGTAQTAAGDMASAATSYKRATELNPKHAAAQRKLAELFAVLGDRGLVEEAEKRLHELLDAAPADMTALNTLAFAELKLGKRKDAIRHLEEVLSASPQQLNSAVLLARAKLAENDTRGAEQVLETATAQNPNSPAAFVLLGRFFSGLDRLPEAERQFQQALRLQPQNAPAMFYLGMLENAQGHKQAAEEYFKALSTHAEKVYWPVYGMFLFQEGRKEEAVREIESVYRKQPADQTARTRLISVYQAINRPADAEKLITSVLEKNPKDLNALLQRSALRLERGNRVEAQMDLNQVLHANPALADAHYIQAKIYEKNGSILSQRQELNETLRINPLFLPARLVLARLLTSTRATKTAIELLDETPAQQKASLAVLVERNWIYGALGNTGEMEKGVQQGLAVQRTPDLLVQDALLQLGRKDFSGAQVSAEEALRSAPEDIRALEVMSGAYVGQNSEAGAAKVQEYVARQPQSATVQLFFGKWLEARGDLKGARAALTAAHTANSDSPDAELALAQLDLLETKWKEARQKIAAVLARNSENITARYWLAQVEEVEGNHNASIEQYRKVVATDPSNATALNNLAFLLSEKADQPGEALPLAQRAKELSPDNAAVTDTLGWVLYRNGLYSLAARNLEDAIAHQSTARRISHLSMAYAKLGATDRARHMLETALKMDPTLPEVKQAQDLLEKPALGKRAGS